MTLLRRNLSELLLLLNASFLLHSHVLIHAASTSPPVTLPRIIFLTALSSEDDYYDDHDDHNSPPPDVVAAKIPSVHQEFQPCQYDSCLENQEPCAQLQQQTGCLCPGVSGADKPPKAPRIQALLPINEGEDRGKVEVKWCAPSSVVSGYRVVVQGQESDSLEFSDDLRRSVVGSLEIGTRVCVEALNQAGHSSPSEFSCKRYDPPKPSFHPLLAGMIGGGVLLLLLIVAGVILWRRKTCQKGKGSSADGLGNPSYSVGETL